ncbi:MAG: transcription antitermination factor NusB [Verrucomicrobia bacterium TMED40]|nr:MAG: transcription antitermination factor NusB [Verrucomicrobia bacterium TMED40]|tara:strand:- start:2554 stop:3015 length:462 start_codon:yes stop_codon:yes gene_type:complete
MDEDLITNPNWSQRRQNRATAFRFLFQWELNPTDRLHEDLAEFIDRLEHDEDYYTYSFELVDGVLDKIKILDSIIQEIVTNWDFSRIAKADLALLRLALYEIKYRLDVPPVVIIDEALEIGKEFSSENSKKFLNGVLDKALEQIDRPARKPAV